MSSILSRFRQRPTATLGALALLAGAVSGCVSASPNAATGTATSAISSSAAGHTTTAARTSAAVPSRHACAPPYPTGAATAGTVLCTDPARLVSARVLRIVDGDTLHVELDGRDETVRLYGINAAERGLPCAIEATERLRALAGDEVRLRADARERDRYRRLLRYVYSPTGLSIDAELVDEGLAKAWRQDGALRVPITELETLAASAHRGCIGG